MSQIMDMEPFHQYMYKFWNILSFLKINFFLQYHYSTQTTQLISMNRVDRLITIRNN